MTRIYMDYDQLWMKYGKSILKRPDLPLVLKYGPDCLRKDRNFVLKAVKENWVF